MTGCSDGLRVLQVTTDDDRRGGQVFATDLAAGLEQLGHQVRTVGLAPGRVGGLNIDTLGSRQRHPLTVARLREAIRGSDVVVGHGSTTLPACAMACAGTGVPFVYRQISDSLFWANTPARRIRVRWALSRAVRVVALWTGAASTFVQHFGVRADRIDCIPNGASAEKFGVADDSSRLAERRKLGMAPAAPVIAYVGALVPEKGVDMAIDAVTSNPSVQLLVAGDGPARADLQHCARLVANRVKFFGSVADPRYIYAASDFVVLPSLGGDSMPAMLIEAGLVGRPAVSTAVAAIPEIVKDGATGLVVQPGDISAFHHAVARLARDRPMRESMGTAARIHCLDKFSIEVVARRWSGTLRQATGSISRSQPRDHSQDGIGNPL